MGLNLRRERFDDWLEEYAPDSRAAFLAKLEEHVGQPIDVAAWQVEDSAYPRVGSYTTYDIFRLCLRYVTEGDFSDQLTADEDVEEEALKGFRDRLKPASVKVPYAAHFLDTGDTDTIFIPILFETPFAYDERFVASLHGAVAALEAFAQGLGFDLTGYAEPEFENGNWLPVSTAKNVARILHSFFTEKPSACVALA